jgi:hypothetical protein
VLECLTYYTSVVNMPISMFGNIKLFHTKTINSKNVRRPGIEPGSKAWEASILPLN